MRARGPGAPVLHGEIRRPSRSGRAAFEIQLGPLWARSPANMRCRAERWNREKAWASHSLDRKERQPPDDGGLRWRLHDSVRFVLRSPADRRSAPAYPLGTAL